MAELEHWIAATPSESGKPEDAFVWLNPQKTGGQGHLWLLVDGVGDRGVGDAVSALVAITVSEVYPEALDMFRDPLKAIGVAIQDADRRLEAVKGVYPDLDRSRASYVAVALFNGAYHVAWAGSARAYRVVAGQVTRLTEDRVESVVAGRVVPSTGVGSGGAIVHLAGSFELENAAIVLATDGVSRSLRDAVVAHGVERLRAWDAATALLEIAEAKNGSDSKAIAVVRATPLEVRSETSVDAFKEWAQSGSSDWMSKTLVLQVGENAPPREVPCTNYPQLPPISGAGGLDEAEAVRESTMSFSPEDVRAIVAGATGELADLRQRVAFAHTDSMDSGESTAAPEPSEGKGSAVRSGSSSSSTMMFSPQELAEVRSDLGRGSALADTVDHESVEETQAFSPQVESLQRLSLQNDRASNDSAQPDCSGDDLTTWRGNSLATSLVKSSWSIAVASLILFALLGGAWAAYLAFFRS